ncbi:MAG: HmuY family protein [Candidatus Symbiothrix sp.]|jgi:hypothetical protein|nr:HmuY family protein [Candidatus Symbiothrix sp.]
MNKKFLFACLGLVLGLIPCMQSCDDDINDIVEGKTYTFAYSKMGILPITIGATTFESPDFGHWHYFTLDDKKGILEAGIDLFELENVNPGGIGTEKISETRKNSTGWDFALHAYDIRTNSGTVGNGGVTAAFIADTTSVTPLETVFANIKNAASLTFVPNAATPGMFYQSLAVMPPTRATQLNMFKSFASFQMLPPYKLSVNKMVVVFKTTKGKYVKVFFKDFQAGENKVNLVLEYALIPAN